MPWPRAGIAVGCKTDPLRYCPDQAVTRAQMATFLVPGSRPHVRIDHWYLRVRALLSGLSVLNSRYLTAADSAVRAKTHRAMPCSQARGSQPQYTADPTFRIVNVLGSRRCRWPQRFRSSNFGPAD